MSIACPGCGREYDVTLFQFGRTLHCTCGRRVGLEKRVGPRLPEADTRPRFLVDEMLEHLARWLRVMGYDAAGAGGLADEALVRRALAEDRMLLTRDRELPRNWRVRNVVVVEDKGPWDQLRALVRRLGLDPEAAPFTRCSRCNEPLVEVGRRELQELESESDPAAPTVPPGVLEREERFRRCPGCGRVYWEGGHTRRMLERLRSLRSR